MQSGLCHRAERILSSVIQHNHLKESADICFVVAAHENHVLKQPEERAVVALLRLQQGQNAVELKEEPSSALCRTDRARQKEKFIKEEEFTCVWRMLKATAILFPPVFYHLFSCTAAKMPQ